VNLKNVWQINFLNTTKKINQRGGEEEIIFKRRERRDRASTNW